MASTGNFEKEGGEGGASSSRKTDSEDDLRLLLECLRFQRHCVSAQKQALTTIATMCSNSNSSRNLFNSTGGLTFVLDLLYSTQSPEIQQASLYTLGCASENNVINQLKLCNESLFSLLAELLVVQLNEASSPLVPNALTIAIAFLAGCLMSNNGQGQNMARNYKLLTRLISVFKAYLPSTFMTKEHSDGASAANQSISRQHSYRLWSSVCSALCTATNNPQNETNQCLCTKLFPAALSVLDLTPLNPDVLRPAISLLASCVANNRTAQDRLRMVGGLQSLVKTLRDIALQANSSQQECDGNVAQVFELALHIVKTLSAAAFGHSANCRALVDLECVKLLLSLLHHEGLAQSTKLNVVLCLGMLTEDNAVSQRQLAENDGMCLLIEVMASSHSEELSKATTFVLQCCVYRNKQQGSPEVEDADLMNKIALIDKLLQANHESPDSKSSPESSVTSRNINQEVLELLDSQKLPMNERVFTWLTNSVPDKQTKPTINKTSEDILKSANVTTQAKKREEIACTDTENKKQDQNMTTKTSCEQMVPKDKPLETQVELELQHEKTLREKIEKQLAQEKEKREQLEQEDKLETQTRFELQREKTLREKLEKQLAQEKEKRQQLKQKVEPIKTKRELELQHEKTLRERLEKQLTQEREKRQQLEQEVSERRITVTQEAQKVDVATSNHQQNSSSQSVVGATSSKHSTAHTPTNRHNPIVSLSAKTPQSSGRSNIRYANSAYIYQNGIQRLLRKTKQDKSIHNLRGKPPNTCANAHSLVEHVHQHRGKENIARRNHHKENVGKAPTKAVRERANDIYIAEILHQSNKSHDNKPDGNVKENISTTVRKRKQTNPTKRIHNQKSPQQISSPVYHTPDVTRHQHSSIPHLVRDSSCSFLSQQLPSSGCDHHCLGCKPRLKCPLITSRNFVKLLRVDRFTCAYHRRLASRIMGGLKEVPTTKPVGNRQPVVYMNQPNPSESSSAASPVSSEVFNQSPCSDQENSTSTYDTSTITSDTVSPAGSDIDCHKMPSPSQYVDVHNQISACDANRSSSYTYEGYSTATSDSEYIPSGSTQSSSSSSSYSCMRSTKCVGKNTLTLPGEKEAIVPKDNTTSKTLSTASRLTRPLVPAVYKLVPGSCKPAYNQVKASEKGSSTIQPRPKLKLLKDVTNQARGRSNMLSSVVPPQKPLTVFDYSTPDGKAGEKYLPQRATKVLAKQSIKASNNQPERARRKQRVQWTEQEEKYLKEGVALLGTGQWRHIIAAYPFHPSRNGDSLRDKYRHNILPGMKKVKHH